MTGMKGQIERVGDGVLVTFDNGASLLFEDRTDALNFGRDLMFVAALGTDTLDEPLGEQP